jgi:hypothetical protein
MSLAVEWTYSAEAALKRIHWRKASDVAAAVHRFAEGRAFALRDGRYGVRGAGHEIVVRVNHTQGTMLVLYFYTRTPP